MNLKHCEIVGVRLSARPGASIGNCFKDALTIAVTEWRNVKLSHSGIIYKITVNDLVGAIEKEETA